MDFQIDHNNVQASATSFTPTDAEKNKYIGFATDTDVDISFDGGTQAFPLSAGTPMLFPEGMTTINASVATKLFYGLRRKNDSGC